MKKLSNYFQSIKPSALYVNNTFGVYIFLNFSQRSFFKITTYPNTIVS